MVPSSYLIIYAARGQSKKMWHVYILHCSDGSLYTGVTTNVERRLHCHNKGRGSKYTRSRRPVELVYVENFTTKTEALRREIEIKDFSIDNKKQLIKHGLGQRFPRHLN